MRALAAMAALSLGACSGVAPDEADFEPATVVVAFDRDTIEPLIVEGVADRTTGRLVKANDPVRVASISKLIMALATMRLADEGKVNLHADVSDWLGWKLRNPDHPQTPVTLAQLLAHRSGLWFDPVSGTGLAYFITAVPPRASAEDEGGFDEREIALIARAQALLASGE